MSQQRIAAPASPVTRARRRIPHFRWAVLATNASVLVLSYGDRAAIGVAAPLIPPSSGSPRARWA
jgi:MFS transporter, ACS family, hexuronate transporter